MNKYIPGNKRINRIRTLGKYAYLATGFGIVIIDVVKMEIYDTWKPGPGPDNNEVFDIAFGNNMIYAATGNRNLVRRPGKPGTCIFWKLGPDYRFTCT